MRALTKDKDGLFFAGDTAQQISVGSSFSFDALKAFLYRLEVSDSWPSTSQLIIIIRNTTRSKIT
jgi:hypothetical protein